MNVTTHAGAEGRTVTALLATLRESTREPGRFVAVDELGEEHALPEGAVLHTFDIPGGGENPQRARVEWSGVRWFLMYENTTWPLAVLEGTRGQLQP